MNPITYLLVTVLGIVTWVIVIDVVMSWLVGFNVLNIRNPLVARVQFVLGQITRPIMAPIRRVVPPVGGLDLSPLIALILISVLQYTLQWADAKYLQ